MSVLAKPTLAPPSPAGEQAVSPPSPTISAANSAATQQRNHLISPVYSNHLQTFSSALQKETPMLH
jgi:hypothetical protein